MRRRSILLVALLAALAAASAAYAVLITLTSSSIDQLGGTGNVDVYCPANPCQIDRVKWVMTPSAPFMVDKVNVNWQTRETTGASYTVYVTLRDNNGNIISSGSATQPASSSPLTTTVDVTPDADPKDVYRVEIVIVQN
jgi:hypothetical protein